MNILKRALRAISDALFPPDCVCILCGKEAVTDEHGLCKSCAEHLISAQDIDEIREHAVYVDDFSVALRYKTENIPDAVARMKYHDETWLAVRLAQFTEIDKSWDVDFITAVPMHILKERFRGYNQSGIIAQTIAKREKLPYIKKAIKKLRLTSQQAGKSRRERLSSQQGVFRADEKICSGKRIIIVDDICTTGTTINECARALKEAGAEKVYAVVLAHG